MRRRTFLRAVAALALPWTRLLDPSVGEPALPRYSGWHSGVCHVPFELTGDLLNAALLNVAGRPESLTLGMISEAVYHEYRVLLKSTGEF